MSSRLVSLNAVTAADRQETTDAIRQLIAEAGGWIEDFVLFSNISLMIRCAISAEAAAAFGNALLDIGLKIDTSELAALTQPESNGKDEKACTLNITFFHNEPDLRRTVPSVPG